MYATHLLLDNLNAFSQQDKGRLNLLTPLNKTEAWWVRSCLLRSSRVNSHMTTCISNYFKMFTFVKECFNFVLNHCSIQHDILTRSIISLFDLLAAKCNPLSPPSFTAVTLAPRSRSKSNTAVCPSLEAQRSGVKPWSSLGKRTIELSMKGHENARDLSQTRPHHDVQVNSINIKSCCFTKLYGTACKCLAFEAWMYENIRSVNCCVKQLRA